MSGNSHAAHFEGIFGTTGSGKTTELKRRLAALPAKIKRRSLVWSPKEVLDDYAALYPGSVVVRKTVDALKIMAEAGKTGEFHIVFVPTLNQQTDMKLFNVLCKASLAAGRMVLIADELHSATMAGNAVDGWRKVNFMGRGFGLYVFGLSQRPASVDKDFMGALSFLHVGRLPHPPDQKTAAEYLGVDWREVAALTGFQAIQRDMVSGEIVRR